MNRGEFVPLAPKFCARDALDVAPEILGALFTTRVDGEAVTVRLTEVEAYHGLGTGDRPDPGSHARMGMTPRNSVMFGDPGRLYVYFNYGMHSAVNLVCSEPGRPSAVLFRAGEVVAGVECARRRRSTSKKDSDLASGPGRFAVATGMLYSTHNGIEVSECSLASLLIRKDPVARYRSGPRVGVSGEGGTEEYPWRFWIEGDPSVSPYRRAKSRRSAS